jgi:hypothetical protein
MKQNPFETRGYRNRNPGNLDRVKGVRWQGELSEEQEQKQDKRFCVFKTHEHGIRAIIRTLVTYATSRKARDGTAIDTVREVIERWAPPIENETESYVATVAKAVGVDPNEPIDILNPIIMRPLVRAIIRTECSGLEYPDGVVDNAMKLAGLEVVNGMGDDTVVIAASMKETPGIAKVATEEETAKEKSVATKLSGLAAAAVALAGAVSAVVAELPKIAQTLDDLALKDVHIITNIWDWLPVALSLVALLAIFLMYRNLRGLTKDRVTNEL